MTRKLLSGADTHTTYQPLIDIGSLWEAEGHDYRLHNKVMAQAP
jgi:hypothetical protein